MNDLKFRETLTVISAICAFVLFIGGANKWNILMSFATLSAVIAAVFLDDIRDALPSPED
jgi:hypothetical protein